MVILMSFLVFREERFVILSPRFLVGTADPHTMLLAAFAESAHIPQKSINQHVTIHTPGGDAKSTFRQVEPLGAGNASTSVG